MKIYLAGGMGDGWQDRVISLLPNITFLDLRSHKLRDEKSYTAWDLGAVRQCDLVLAYMNNANPSGFGLSLEVGYAYGIGRKIWYVCEDTTERQRFFGMVRAVSDEMFYNLYDAIDKLKDLK